MEWIKFPDERLVVNGLGWFAEEKPSLRRLPRRLKKVLREPVWALAQCPAGGRIRFRTDSLSAGIKAKCADNQVMNHITRIGQSGFDIYVDNVFMGSVAPDEKGSIKAEWQIAATPGMREIVINMPLYKAVKISSLGLDEGALLAAPSPFALEKPVIYYGTSITQGGCASTPGTSYQGFLSRALNIDFINLGFSGNGKGEPELAKAICELDAACIVLDHWANMGDGLGENLPHFVGELRKVHRDTPIIVMGPFFFSRENAGNETNGVNRKAAKAFVRKMKGEGDDNIFFFDGLKMIAPEKASGLVDGVHCNSLGFYFMAEALAPFLKRILGL